MWSSCVVITRSTTSFIRAELQPVHTARRPSMTGLVMWMNGGHHARKQMHPHVSLNTTSALASEFFIKQQQRSKACWLSTWLL
jgi:hypothetical protein